MKKRFGRLLLNWYDQNARRLPWRGSADPYAVWVSEVMLQQTRVETVTPYYLRWMERFPDIASLAAASDQEVLGMWEGLGYYARARNLWRAARRLVESGEGKLPADALDLEKLPGIGRYMAGAIASIAFGAHEPALDGNVKRVLARVFDLELPIDRPEGLKYLWSLAAELLPAGRAGDHNQALMDLGALICLARNPKCDECPLQAICQARRHDTRALRPVRSPRRAIPHITVVAALIWKDGLVLIARRPPHGLLGGMWEFPGGKQQTDESLTAALEREILEELDARIEVGIELGVYRHAYTHMRVTLHAFHCRLTGAAPRPLEASALAWVKPGELVNYPMGHIDRSIANDLVKAAAIDCA
ncbi:MAG: A/G-specific adenine glycosylase [Anaerolineaceae bacterium]|nr:A/G-specific adenine glycosylase [Anaerolineaceae bacterium]